MVGVKITNLMTTEKEMIPLLFSFKNVIAPSRMTSS